MWCRAHAGALRDPPEEPQGQVGRLLLVALVWGRCDDCAPSLFTFLVQGLTSAAVSRVSHLSTTDVPVLPLQRERTEPWLWLSAAYKANLAVVEGGGWASRTATREAGGRRGQISFTNILPKPKESQEKERRARGTVTRSNKEDRLYDPDSIHEQLEEIQCEFAREQQTIYYQL